MSTTQEHIPIADIDDGILFLKDGGGALVLQTSAVNFGLLSDGEQMAIITAFAQMLNSLSFTIQIVIHSQRLNISSYLNLLDKAQKAQTNPLLSQIMTQYRQFIQATIKENEVLDKKFYIATPLFRLELGLTPTKEALYEKIKTVLLPRRDQVLRQLGRVGLKATQLTDQKLLETFFNIYSGETLEAPAVLEPVRLKQPKQASPLPQNEASPIDKQQPQMVSQPTETWQGSPAKNHPFVVEELNDSV